MWEAIASSDDVLIGHITPENDWAVDVGLAARLELDQGGYLALRHMSRRSRTSPTAPSCDPR